MDINTANPKLFGLFEVICVNMCSCVGIPKSKEIVKDIIVISGNGLPPGNMFKLNSDPHLVLLCFHWKSLF